MRRAAATSGITFSPSTRLASTMVGARTISCADHFFEQRNLVGHDASARRRARVRASPSRMRRAPRAPTRNAAHFSSGSTTMRGRTGQPAVASRHALRRDAAPSAARARTDRAFRRESRSPAPNTGSMRRISPRRLPGSTSTRGGSPSRRALSSRLGRRSLGDLGQRMADIGAGRPAEPRMRRRLERQQRQHVIDVARASRAPARAARPTPTATRSR